MLLVTPYSRASRDWSPERVGVALVAAVLPLYTAYRLATAYRLYLRFDHPRATAASAQFIVWLVVVIFLLNLTRL